MNILPVYESLIIQACMLCATHTLTLTHTHTLTHSLSQNTHTHHRWLFNYWRRLPSVGTGSCCRTATSSSTGSRSWKRLWRTSPSPTLTSDSGSPRSPPQTSPLEYYRSSTLHGGVQHRGILVKAYRATTLPIIADHVTIYILRTPTTIIVVECKFGVLRNVLCMNVPLSNRNH